jgi:hypothetical protein
MEVKLQPRSHGIPYPKKAAALRVRVDRGSVYLPELV